MAFAALLLAIVFAAWAARRLRASLPQLDGEIVLDGLEAPVRIERDELGVPTIRAASEADAVRALGFLHAQDRFFQMDLTRRQTAGELAEVLGEAALPSDRRFRVHRLRYRARTLLDELPREERVLAEAYTQGVNAGLASLGARPFEYDVLRADPRPWSTEDTFLTVYAMYFQLNDYRANRESFGGLIYDLLGPEMYDFLLPLGTEWDAAIDGTLFEQPLVPPAEIFDLRELPQPDTEVATLGPPPRLAGGERMPPAAGSNNWAVAGAHTVHGGALLANDMHLGLSVPNIWYRASIVIPPVDGGESVGREAEGGSRIPTLTGVTLPGTPFVIAGSNGAVAWGFTNTWGDWEDLVVLEPVPGDPDAYRSPGGPRTLERHHERIVVRDGEDDVVEVEATIWGPVVDTDHRGRKRALRWIAHDRRGVTFALRELRTAATVEEAIGIANRVGAPPQNFVVADSSGRIGWTVMGPVPRRFGHDGRRPASWADGARGWDGWLEPSEYPRILDPPVGRIWTANSRVVGGEMMEKIGVGVYRLGARGRQIRDDLMELDRASETALLAVQLDDRALFLERWRRLLLDVLDEDALAGEPARRELRRLAEHWGGRATVDSAGYRLVRAFRLFLADDLLGAITAVCKKADDRFDFGLLGQYEGPLWTLVSERPAHFVAPPHESWDRQLLAAVDRVLEYFSQDGEPLAEQTWGRRNTARIQHPLSRVAPFAGRWLDMPSDRLPGDANMPRYQAPAEGASERMVVSPGREEDGIFHMPTGQSGHPLSPFYRKGHDAWVHGKPTPFLPGPVAHTLTLVPRDSGS